MFSEAQLLGYARRQRGHVTLAQLRQAGLAEAQITYRCQRKGWTRVLPRVYRLPGYTDDFDGCLVAARLWLGHRGFFTGQTGAYLMNVDPVVRPHRITIACWNNARTPRWIRSIRLASDDRPKLRNVAGFRVPAVPRVLLDMARSSGSVEVGEALDCCLRKRLTTVGELCEFIHSHSNRPGIPVLRRLLQARNADDAKVRSDFETRMLHILRRIREAKAVPDFKLVLEGMTFYLDFFFPTARLGIECQSLRFHASEGWLTKDLKRDRALQRAGIEVLYFTWDEVVHHPDAVEAEIRAALRLRLRANLGPTPS